jgi:heat shock protein HslJ
MKNLPKPLFVLVAALFFFGTSSCKNQSELASVSKLLPSLIGKEFQVSSLFGQALDPANYQQGLPHFKFDDDSSIKGNTGCNGFTAAYEMAEGLINFKPGPMTKRYCEGVDENGFLKALNETRNLKMDGENLLFMGDSGKQLMSLIPKK